MPHRSAGGVARHERRAPRRRHPLSPRHGRVEHRAERPGDRYHQQAVEICERTGFADLVAVQAYHGRGEAHFANAEPAAAIECYTRSLELARGIGDKSYESENLMMIGHACVGTKGLGDYPRATDALRGGARNRACRRPAVAHRTDAARTRPCAGVHRPLRRGVVRHARDPALAREPQADALSAHRPRFHRAISCSTSA